MAFNELRAISTFVKAAELGSLRKAAGEQGVSPQAASQSLTQLELHLGVRLFHRTTRKLSLTDEGEEFLATAKPGLHTLERALLGARKGSEGVAGPLRIVGPRSTMLQVLPPVLEEFCKLHPEVRPDVQLDDKLGNWVESRVDVGFRAGSPPDTGVIARRLMPLQLIVCASPGYLLAHGTPTSIDDLVNHRCSGFRSPQMPNERPWDFKVGNEIVSRMIPAVFTTNDLDVEASAVVAGEVIGQIDGVTATPLVRSGALIPVLGQHMVDHLGLYIYYGSRVALPKRIRAFIDLAVERLVDNDRFFLHPHELMANIPVKKPRRRAA
ncbi:LysR family transcriptional regulator [Xylophilus sp. GOD-11R]|uniref:LysR family transcriptional regulator n=1 Tax=Xylophilus sp. GOD-11R TaxID=3089814 RepID=UPI00298BD9FE|nr:LysR family transcriptional regulator [Xylophilus sp. GOD-11R]WPB58342.1 LysR family transcriptional regulator [Xylophilus sp. GOD-11R]